jgi:hypothetical protein
MTESRLDKIPNEIQLNILCRLSIQSLICLYQTSHYWKHRISNDKQLWCSVYERNFGHEFAKDRWILWAVRRLWSQSPSEEKRLAARRVSLTTLEHLDGYTWYRLVRGRILTMRNWRNNTPQRVIIFSKDQSDMPIYQEPYGCSSLSYGIPIISDDCDKLGFGIVDDTLNDARLVSVPDTLLKKVLSLQTHCDNIVLGRVVHTYSTPHMIDIFDHVTDDEFIVIEKKINKRHYHTPIVMLVWNIGNLEIHNTEHQSYCVPRLCMAELLPHRWRYLLEQQSGWLLVEDLTDFTKSKQWYLLYDIRRGRLAMSFSTGTDIKPVIGKVTPNKVQIYYGHITRISSDTMTSGSYQYYWHTIEVSIQSDIPTSTADLTWYDQTPTSEAIETVRAKYRAIMECVKDQGHWCGEGYLLKTNSASEGILLPVEMGLVARPQHLIDDLFLLSNPSWRITRDNFLLVHSLSQQHVIWSKGNYLFHKLIPDEKAILTYDEDGTIQLLNMYTGDVLNSFNIQKCNHIHHVIGPLCSFYSEKSMLIDVCTGETIRMLKSDPVIQSWILPVLLPYMESDNNPDDLESTHIEDDITDVLGPTRIEYANTEVNSAMIFEYAQI